MAAAPNFHNDRQQVHLRRGGGDDDGEDGEEEEEEEEMVVGAPVSLRNVLVLVVFKKITI